MPNESATIILAATHGKLAKIRDALAIEHTVNALKVEFQFRTKDWDNTTKTAVFVRGRATPSTSHTDTIHVVLDNSNTCNVPAEVLVHNGYFSVGVFGVADNYILPSNWIHYQVTDGCYVSGSTPIDATPSLYEQILKILKNKSDIGHNHDAQYYTKKQSDDKYLTEKDLPTIPVTSVNQKTGDVVLTANDVGAFANIRQGDAQVPTIPFAAIIDPPRVTIDDAALVAMLKEVLV